MIVCSTHVFFDSTSASSIKTRIKTRHEIQYVYNAHVLVHLPLKQGLRHRSKGYFKSMTIEVLVHLPLKQGLRQQR